MTPATLFFLEFLLRHPYVMKLFRLILHSDICHCEVLSKFTFIAFDYQCLLLFALSWDIQMKSQESRMGCLNPNALPLLTQILFILQNIPWCCLQKCPRFPFSFKCIKSNRKQSWSCSRGLIFYLIQTTVSSFLLSGVPPNINAELLYFKNGRRQRDGTTECSYEHITMSPTGRNARPSSVA